MSTQSTELITRSVEAMYRPGTVNEENRTVEVVMSSETPYMRRTWRDGVFNEVLSHDPAHVRLGRMSNGAPVLDNHNRWGSAADNVVGVVESVRLQDGQMVGTLRFDTDEKGEAIFRKIANGILRKFSIGYTIYKYEDSEREGETVQRTVTDWEPYEVSAVPVAADDSASARSNNHNRNNFNNMPTENGTQPGATSEGTNEQRSTPPTVPAPAPAPAPAPTPAVDTDAVRAAERARINDINENARMAGLDTNSDFVRKLIENGTDFTEASRAIAAEYRRKGAEQAVNTTPTGSVVNEENNMRAFLNAAEEALLIRAGVRDEEGKQRSVTPEVRPLVGLSMIRFMETNLRKRGVNTDGMTNYEIAKRALRAGGGHTGSDFPILFNNVINRSLRAAYSFQERTFLPFTSGTTHPDFRLQEKAKLSSMVGDLDLVPEGGEYKAGTFQESVEGYRVDKYGKLFTYTMEMAVNDNIGFFQRVPAAFALAAAQRQSDLVYGILTGNPAMGDGHNLFSAEHNNLMTGAAISDASLGLAKAAFKKQTDETGKYINVVPRFLIVGPDLEQEAAKILTAITANTVGDVNVHSGSLQLIVEPRLGSGWFLAANPTGIDTIEYAFLAGQPELFTETMDTFNIDGTQIKARMVFGTKAIDHRGLLFNPGA